MIDWLSKSTREKKKEAAQEQKLKESLAAKISQYQDLANDQVDDHTEIFIGGKKLRVAKEQITLHDTSVKTTSKPK